MPPIEVPEIEPDTETEAYLARIKSEVEEWEKNQAQAESEYNERATRDARNLRRWYRKMKKATASS